MKHIHIVLILSILFLSCKSKQVAINSQLYAATQKIVIYKTIKDYSNYVPVTMNASKTEIISYPAPSDLLLDGKTTTPTKLKNGYLLDNRGINENVVFLKYTYEDYSKLKEAPSLSEMKKNILEKYPLSGLIYFEKSMIREITVKSLNKLIDTDFEGCKKIDIVPLQIVF